MAASTTSVTPPPTRVLTAAQVEELTDWRETIDALREAYAGRLTDAMVPARSMARDTGIWLRGLTAISTSGEHVGAKLITVNRENVHASYVILLIDRQNGSLVAMMDGNHITGLRTAATSAVLVDAATLTRPLQVAVIGSGFEAYNHLLAAAAVREVASATVYSPRESSRQSFAQRAADQLGLKVTPAGSPQEAVVGADLILCAARSRDEQPTLRGAWVEPGTTVVSIGSTLPEQREVGTDLIARADRIVADMVSEVVHDTGDFIAARADGVIVDDQVVSLADVIGGRHPARTSDQEIVLYKSVGSALQDIVVAESVLRKAAAQDIGALIPPFIQPVDK